MKKNLYSLTLLFLLISCSKKKDFEPDLTDTITGKYNMWGSDLSAIDANHAFVWTISRTGKNVVKLKHQVFEGEKSGQPGMDKSKEVFSTTIDGIKVTEAYKFKVNQTFDFMLDGSPNRSWLIMDVILHDHELNAELTQTRVSSGTTADFLSFLKE